MQNALWTVETPKGIPGEMMGKQYSRSWSRKR